MQARLLSVEMSRSGLIGLRFHASNDSLFSYDYGEI